MSMSALAQQLRLQDHASEGQSGRAKERLNKGRGEENGHRKFRQACDEVDDCALSWAYLVDVRVLGASRAVYAAEQRNR
jgi:hypothetical protein